MPLSQVNLLILYIHMNIWIGIVILFIYQIIIEITVWKFKTTNLICICLLLGDALGSGFVNIPVALSRSYIPSMIELYINQLYTIAIYLLLLNMMSALISCYFYFEVAHITKLGYFSL